MCGTQRRVLVCKVLTNISYLFFTFFTLPRAEGSIQSGKEHGKAAERRDGTPCSWFLCVGIREVSLLPAWVHGRGGGVVAGDRGRDPFAPFLELAPS